MQASSMFIKIFILALTFIQLHSENTLNSNYYIDSKSIRLNTVVPKADSDIILFEIEKGRHSKRISSKELIKILKNQGYSDYSNRPRYVNFILKSPIDTSRIKRAIKEYYEKEYKFIQINSISVEPRSFMTSLPDEYVVNIDDRDYLKRSGTINIKTSKNKKIFFNYNINATVTVHVSKKNIRKDVELSASNTLTKHVLIDSFKAKPITQVTKGKFQAKHYIPKNKVLTNRDVEQLSVVRRNSNISVSLLTNGMNISFSAKSLQNGKLNDIIKVQKSNGKILKVKVIGKNKAEMR